MEEKTETSTLKGKRRSKRGGAKAAVCLIYPNRSEIGLSNLGFHKIFNVINESGHASCDIAFLPEKGKPISKTQKARLSSFDLLAFSITFEMDIFNVIEILSRSGVPPLREKRDERQPLVCAGGVSVTLNPEPFSDFFDFFVIGEGEVTLDKWIGILNQKNRLPRREKLEGIAKVEGVYVPSLYEAKLRGDGGIADFSPKKGAPAKVKRLYNKNYESEGSAQQFIAKGVFKDSYLIETGKGCAQGCRFCAAGFVYRPVRHVNTGVLKEQIEKGLGVNKRIGLVGSAICEHPQINEVYDHITACGGGMSVSSLRIGLVDGKTFKRLAKGGLKTVTIAPEAGTLSLRRAINKDISDDEILACAEMAAGAGILNMKLYFLIGLPGERDEDIIGIVSLVKRLRDVFIKYSKPFGRAGKITVGVNPFVPKPHTPFQWAGIAPVKELKEKSRLIKKNLSGESNIRLKIESPKNAHAQALLSLGSRSIGGVILKAFNDNNRGSLLDFEEAAFICGRTKPMDEIFPWDFIDTGVSREYLWKEYEKSKRGKVTPPCPPAPSGCKKCGVFEGVCI